MDAVLPIVKNKNKLLISVFCLTLLFLTACSSGINTTPQQDSRTNKNESVKQVGEAKIGAYIVGAVWDHDILYDLEDSIGHEFNIIQWFTSWPTVFEADRVNAIIKLGRMPLITWQSKNQSLDDIIAGKYDDYLRSWATGVKSVYGDVYLRPFPEMNGDWVPWNGEPKKLIKAWKHIVNTFHDEGVTNVKWVWSPNITDEPRIASNRMERYYPGKDYVDVFGLSGYNWGTVRDYTAWKSFSETFAEPYERISALGTQPIWLAEIASTEQGGDKAEWIKDMLSSTSFPQIDAIIWFNEDKETDWRIESSVASTNAFKEWFMQAQLRRTLGFVP